MTWVNTYSGGQFNLSDPNPRDVRIEDIAHALAGLNRFTAATGHYYTVAEHCVRLSYEVPRSHALWALLHDAAEAYVGDLNRFLKQTPALRGFVEIEERVLEVVAEAFGIEWPVPAVVEEADRRLGDTEARDLLQSVVVGHPFDHLTLSIPWTPGTAKAKFLARFAELSADPDPTVLDLLKRLTKDMDSISKRLAQLEVSVEVQAEDHAQLMEDTRGLRERTAALVRSAGAGGPGA